MIYILTTAEEVRSFVDTAPPGNVYFDFETTGLDPYTCYVLLLALKVGEHEYVIDCTKVSDWAQLVKPLLEDTERTKVAHNAVFDYKFLFHHGIRPSPVYCTMITEQLLNSGLIGLGNSLQAIALRRLRESMDKSVREGFIGRDIKDVTFSDSELRYAAKDVQVLPAIMAQQLREIRIEEMEDVHSLEMKLIPITARMEYAGIGVDLGKVAEARPAFEEVLRRVNVALQEAFINAGITNRIVFSRDGFEAVRVSSPSQMLAAFGELGIKVESTDSSVLADWDAAWYAAQKSKKSVPTLGQLTAADSQDILDAEIEEDAVLFHHPVLRLHSMRSIAEKALSTYIVPIPGYVNPVTKRVHPNFNQCGAGATGRYSSSSPNFQNLVKASRLRSIGLDKYDIRSFFVAEPGYKFITCDFEGIELVILAALSGDENLIYQIQQGDIHSHVGSTIFRKPFDKKMAKKDPLYGVLRDVSKTVTYSIMYGVSGMGLYNRVSSTLAPIGIKMTRETGEEWISEWYGLFPKTAQLLKSNGEMAVTRLHTKSVLGRRRHWSPDMLRTRGAIGRAIREGKNAPIQSSSADLTKLSELLLDEQLVEGEAELIACIHDELIVRVVEDRAEHYAKITEEAMREAGRKLFPNLPPGMIRAEAAIVDYYSK